MIFKRLSLTVLVIGIFAIAVPTLASAVKLPTYYVYKKCKTKNNCSAAIYTNSANTKIVALQLFPKCKTKTSYFSAANSGNVSINSSHKYSKTLDGSSYDKGADSSVAAKVTVSGKVTKKDKVTLKYAVDKTSPGCSNITSGTLTLKYVGSQSGG